MHINQTFNKKSEIESEREGTLTAAMTAWPTTPGSACHVPKPTEGIFAPVLSVKYAAISLFFFFSFTPHSSLLDIYERLCEALAYL